MRCNGPVHYVVASPKPTCLQLSATALAARRALLQDAHVLALDEATANVDRGTGGSMQFDSVNHQFVQIECKGPLEDCFFAGSGVKL